MSQHDIGIGVVIVSRTLFYEASDVVKESSNSHIYHQHQPQLEHYHEDST